MRAVVAGEGTTAASLAVGEAAVPEPGPGQVLIRVAYAALNPMDAHALAGRIRWGVPARPFVLGYEYAGRVVGVGDGVADELVGERVRVAGQWGGLADYAVADADRLLPIPARMGWPLGTVYASTTATAWHALHTVGRLAKGELVVVHSAAGPVGVMATQIAREAGATVVGLVGSAEKLGWAAAFGADLLVDYRRDADWPSRVRAWAGRGADLVVDGVQGPGAAKNLDALAPFGRVVYLGAAAGPAPDVPVATLIAKSVSVAGMVVYDAIARTGGREMQRLQRRLLSGRWVYPLNPPFGLDDAAAAFAAFERRELRGRSIFRVGGEI